MASHTSDANRQQGRAYQGHRYPAPGSVHRAAVPVRDSEDTVYDIKNYSRNPDNLALDVGEMTFTFFLILYILLALTLTTSHAPLVLYFLKPDGDDDCGVQASTF